MPVIKCSNLEFSYSEGVPVLRNVSFSIPQGQYCAIVGANGSGKSTLARHFNGLLRPKSGSVYIDGYSTGKIEDIPVIRKTVGMVFQTPESQIVGTTVETDIAFALENTGVPRHEIYKRIKYALKNVGLIGFEKRATGQLSGGEQQKLALGCMIAMNSDILVFDEATSMIEPKGRIEIQRMLKNLHDQGKTIISITHDMDEALNSDRILHFHNGSIKHDLAPHEFFQLPDLEQYRLSYPRILSAAKLIHKSIGEFEYTGNDQAKLIEEIKRLILKSGKNSPADKPFRKTTLNTDKALYKTNRSCICFDKCTYSYLHGTDREQRGISNVSLNITKNEIIGIIGNTGSGKSTLLQHINALILPKKGSVRINGENTADKKTDLRALRRKIGFAFQRPEKQLFKTFTGDDVAFGLENSELNLSEKAVAVKTAMEKTGLDYSRFKDRPIYALSGGEKRKAALSGVLVNDPEFLILDEPTSGLDPVSSSEVLKTIRSEHKKGKTVIFATHDLEVLSSLADRVIQMDEGEVLFDGSADDFFFNNNNNIDPELLPSAVRISLSEGLSKFGISGKNNSQLAEALEEALKEAAL